jgi:UDP-N-acetylglucosamine 2-epimerase (non-hydrolysing)
MGSPDAYQNTVLCETSSYPWRLGVPCLTVRENTERPITISEGTNFLVGTNPEVIVRAARDAIAGRSKKGRIPPLRDGRAAKRIVEMLLRVRIANN